MSGFSDGRMVSSSLILFGNGLIGFILFGPQGAFEMSVIGGFMAVFLNQAAE